MRASEKQSWIRRWWFRETFDPDIFGVLINPFYIARRGLISSLREFLPEFQGALLDVGCGQCPYRKLLKAERYTGMDLDTPVTRALRLADVLYDGKTFPFPDFSFDHVLCSQVFEHVFAPQCFLREIGRVLRPGGTLLLTVPFVWDEHEQPHDFARYTSFGLRSVLQNAGFEIVAQRKSVANFGAIVQLVLAWIYKKTRSRYRALNLLAQLMIIAPITLIGLALTALLGQNTDFYLDNIVLARKVSR